MFGTKNVWINKIGSEKIVAKNNVRFKKNLGSKLILGQKIIRYNKILGRKVWSNLV